MNMQQALAQHLAPLMAGYAQTELGLEQSLAFKSIEKSLPAVLAGVLAHVGDEHAAKRFFNLITGSSVDANWLKNGALQGDALANVLKLGRQWSGLLFGKHAAAVAEAVAHDAAIEPAQAQALLDFAVPGVLAALKQWLQSEHYGQHEFYAQLLAQEGFFSKIFSPKLLAALGYTSALAMSDGLRTWGSRYFGEQAAESAAQTAANRAPQTAKPAAASSARTAPDEAPVKSAAWLKWLAAVVVLAVLAWLGKDLLNSDVPQPTPQNNAPAAVSEPQAAVSEPVADASAPQAASAASGQAAAASAAAPAENAAAHTQSANGSSRFYFEPERADVSDDAAEQAADVLKAAQNGKTLSIEGYKDAADSAGANDWLAKKRANMVRSFLREHGVAAKQIKMPHAERSAANEGERFIEVKIAAE